MTSTTYCIRLPYQRARFCSEETSLSLIGVTSSLTRLWPVGFGLKSPGTENNGPGILSLCRWPLWWRKEHEDLCNTTQIIQDMSSRDKPELESLPSFSCYGFSSYWANHSQTDSCHALGLGLSALAGKANQPHLLQKRGTHNTDALYVSVAPEPEVCPGTAQKVVGTEKPLR